MTTSELTWINYITRITKIKGAAREKVEQYILKNGVSDIDKLSDYVYSIVTKYGEGSSATAAEMYDALAEAQKAGVPPAELAETASYSQTKKAVETGDNIPQIAEALVKQAGEDTIWQNAKRDGAEMAWIPFGGSTCAFCRVLASNGWRHASKKTMAGKHATHIHANCRCAFAVRFDGKSNIAGYDPAKYSAEYERAPGKDAKAKADYLRREDYKKNKDDLNERRRELYAMKHPKKDKKE